MKASSYPSSTATAAKAAPLKPVVATARSFALPLGFSERRLILFFGDVLVLAAAGIVAAGVWAAVRPDITLTWGFIARQAPRLLGLGLAWMLLYATNGGYDLTGAARTSTISRRLLRTAVAFAVIYLGVFFLLSQPEGMPTSFAWFGRVRTLRVVPSLFVVFGLIGELIWRNIYARTLTGGAFQRRALVVGAGWAGRTIVETLAEHGDGTYRAIGFVDDDPLKAAGSIALPPRPQAAIDGASAGAEGTRLPILGNHLALRDLIERHNVSALILAITREVPGEWLPMLMDCLELGVEIVPMPLLYEDLTGRVPVEHVGENWYVAMPINHAGTAAAWMLVKRLIDILVALVGLAVLALLFPVLALAICLDSPGPIIYSQERVGKGGRTFRIHKLRSMVPNAEKNGAMWARLDDPRVTRVGRFLRKTHLDETPQLVNILRGDMSLVGPRPERPEKVQELAAVIPFYRVRHAVKPGAAGWALIEQGYGASTEDALLKLQYDLYYIKHQSLWLDSLILLRTVGAMLALSGR